MNPIYRWMARSTTKESQPWRELPIGTRIGLGLALAVLLVTVVTSAILRIWGPAAFGAGFLVLVGWPLFIQSWWRSRGGFQISRAHLQTLFLLGFVGWTAMAAIDGNPWFFYRLAATTFMGYFL